MIVNQHTHSPHLCGLSFDCEPAYLVLRVLDSILSDELQFDQLEQLLCIWDSVEDGAQIYEGLLVVYAGQGGEGVPLACGVALGLEECSNQVGGIGDQRGRVLKDGGNGEDGILPYIGVTVLETRSGGGEEGLDEFGFAELAQEAQSVASDVLVGMLKIVSDAIAVGKAYMVSIGEMETRGQLPRKTYQTRIISCLSLPLASSFGQIS